MDLKKLFIKYRRKKELYVSRLEKAWDEELSSKDSLVLAKTCSDILDSVVKMAKTLEELSPSPPQACSPLDSMSDEELERHIKRAEKALSDEPAGGLEAPGENRC